MSGYDRHTAHMVYGKPATKGSSVSFMRGGRVVHMPACPGLKGWEKKVAESIKGVTEPLKCPLFISLEFYFKRPKTHFISNDGRRLKGRISLFHTKYPDIDKLTRAMLDGLTGSLYEDDRQVVSVFASKKYLSDNHRFEGCRFWWVALEDTTWEKVNPEMIPEREYREELTKAIAEMIAPSLIPMPHSGLERKRDFPAISKFLARGIIEMHRDGEGSKRDR